ncbi:MAG TPA: DUF4388 domain-containing protein [Acidobacteriota bacterium]|nr:DUF4388 domain-containing protein [Acidobacteriota bacterium]
MQGDLSKISVPELLLEIYLSRQSGILRLTKEDIRKGVYFKDGSIVFAHSNLKNDRLGETLLRLGKITEEEFEAASEEVIQNGKRLGRTLWEKGFLSPAEVNAGVNYQLQQIVYSVFDWDSGEYEFVERERPVYEDIMVDVSTPDLILGGTRSITNSTVLERLIGTDEDRMVEVNVAVRKLPRNTFDFGEDAILGAVDGKLPLRRLRLLVDLSTLEFHRALCSLLLSGIIRIRKKTDEEQAGIPAERPHGGATTRPLPAAEKVSGAVGRFKTFSEDEVRQLVEQTASRLDELTDEEVLGVLPDCTAEEIDQGYKKLTDVFHPLYYSEDRHLDLKDKLKLICDRLAEAHDVLIEKSSGRRLLSETVLREEKAISPDAEIIHEIQKEVAEVARPGNVAEKQQAAPPAPQTEVRVEKRAVTAIANEPQPQRESTISELEERIRREPGNVSLLRDLARRLLIAGRAVDAEKNLARALELEPQNIDNHFALAEFYQAKGLKLKAFKHLNIVLQLQPEHPRAMKMLGATKPKRLMYEISKETK